MKKLIICLTVFLCLIIVFILPCTGEECSGDIDCDGVVDGKDLAELANDFGKTGCTSQFVSAIRVYDGDDQYLGILLGNVDKLEIFIPSLKASTGFRHEGEVGWAPYGFLNYLGLVYFDEPNCAGAAFVKEFEKGYANYLYRAGNDSNPKYFVRRAFNKEPIQLESELRLGTNGWSCSNNSELFGVYSVDEIPEADIPFTLPIAVPLRFE